jgi:site-specific recombinase XerD
MTTSGDRKPMQVVEPPSKSSAGRPRGSRTRVLREQQALGVHHFAFLRSWMQGLDLRQAWQRYMAFGEVNADPRHMERLRAALLQRVLRDAHVVNLTLPEEQRITAELGLLAQPPRGPGLVALPSLDEFVATQGLDREAWAEEELLREYREFFGLDGAAPSDGTQLSPKVAQVSEQVRALLRVERLLARRPAPSDLLSLWLSPTLADRLRETGITTLETLVQTINVHGANWWRRVRGLGRARAASMLEWLQPLATGWKEAPLGVETLATPQRSAALQSVHRSAVTMPARFALVPLEQLAVPTRLAGGKEAPGLFATRMPNHLAAQDDRQAVEAWLAQFRDKPATSRAYRKEVERFYLWCLLERGKPLSSVDSLDAQAYRDFIRQPPAHWCCAAVVGRDDPAWRPFRGPLGPASQRQALVVIQALYDGLRDANYVVGNPLRAVNKRAALMAARLDIDRSFTDAEWAFVRGQLDLEAAAARGRNGVPAGAEQRRLRMVIELLAGTGLRLAEMAGATTASLRDVTLDGQGRQTTLLTVEGKGRKQRELPLADDLAALIWRHHADAAAVSALPEPAPLVCTLAEAPPRWTADGQGGIALHVPATQGRALGTNGLYRTLKRFFARIAQRACAIDGLDASRLQAASTHWLRHTFARQGAAAQMPVEVLQQALGHASLTTTTVYLSTERTRMVQEFEKLRARRGGA